VGAFRDGEGEGEVMNKTPGAIKACAEWLSFCLRIGWRRDRLDALESLWWQHHDGKGRLV